MRAPPSLLHHASHLARLHFLFFCDTHLSPTCSKYCHRIFCLSFPTLLQHIRPRLRPRCKAEEDAAQEGRRRGEGASGTPRQQSQERYRMSGALATLSACSHVNSRRQVGLANVGKSTLFQAITKCHLGNPAVSCTHPPWHGPALTSAELSLCHHRPRGGARHCPR